MDSLLFLIAALLTAVLLPLFAIFGLPTILLAALSETADAADARA